MQPRQRPAERTMAQWIPFHSVVSVVTDSRVIVDGKFNQCFGRPCASWVWLELSLVSRLLDSPNCFFSVIKERALLFMQENATFASQSFAQLLLFFFSSFLVYYW